MLERETWFNVPVSVSQDLGGMAGVVGNHTRGLAWPAMNGWGCVRVGGSFVREGRRDGRVCRRKAQAGC